MDAADDYQEAMTQTGRKRARAALAALVAEACAPQPERVCRWTTMRGPDGGEWRRAECPGNSTRRPAMTGTFCPDCGGRVEVVAEGQEVE